MDFFEHYGSLFEGIFHYPVMQRHFTLGVVGLTLKYLKVCNARFFMSNDLIAAQAT
nr:hypothetical protein [uncultured Amphritea sp.]